MHPCTVLHVYVIITHLNTSLRGIIIIKSLYYLVLIEFNKRTILFIVYSVFFDNKSESEIYFARSSLVFELEGRLGLIMLFNEYFQEYFQ